MIGRRAIGSRVAAASLLCGALLVLGAPRPAAGAGPAAGEPSCGAAEGAGSDTDDGVLRVATYNVLHSQGDDADETLDRRVELVVGELAAAGVDVAGLQEVVRSANHGMVAERIATGLADSTGDTWGWCFFQSNPHVRGETDTGPGGVGGTTSQQIAEVARPGDSPWAEGVAVVSRFPIEASVVHRLPPRTAEIPFCEAENPDDPLAGATCQLDTRTVMLARAATTCGGVDFFTSHLANDESSRSEATRERQIADALAWIDGMVGADGAPDVYVGDFNTLESGPVWGAVVDAGFTDAFRSAEPDGDGFTSNQEILADAATVERRIDYVFAREGGEPIDPGDAEILGDEPAPVDGADGGSVVWPSDHYGVAVSLSTATPCRSAAGTAVAPVPTRAELARTGPGAGAVAPAAVVLVVAGAVVLGLRRRLDPSREAHLP